MKPSKNSIMAYFDDEKELKRQIKLFNKHLWTYKAKPDQASQEFYDCAFDLFFRLELLSANYKEMEKIFRRR